MTEPTQNPKPKSPAPLYVLAGTSFIPVLGLVLGAIGLTWGLLSSRPNAIRAGVISAVGAMLNFVGLFALGFYLASGDGEITARAQEIAVQQDLVKIVRALEEYHEETGAYPAALTDLQRRPAVLRTLNLFDHTGGVFRPRVYEYELSRDGTTYDLFSVGRDGEAGTEDDIRPVLPDSLAAVAGYRPEK
jgi:hypothetical protein